MTTIAARRQSTSISNPVLAMAIFLISEVMLFAGLFSAYWVLRAGVETWPPLDQPRLPILVTGINTALLLMSGAFVWSSIHRAATRAAETLRLGLILGVTFLIIQGYEWVRMLSHGLTAKSSLYGASFYSIVGLHAVHVTIGLLVLAHVSRRAPNVSGTTNEGLRAAALFWLFVVGVWPLVYVLLYLA